MQYYFSIFGFINGIVALLLGTAFMIRNRHDLSHRLFFILSLIASIYSFSFWRWHSVSGDEQVALVWIKFFIVGLVLQPVLYFHFVTVFLDIKRTKFLAAYYAASAYYLLLTFIDFFVKDVSGRSDFMFWPGASLMFYLLAATHFIALTAYLIFLLAEYYGQKQSLQKLQIKYLIAATIFAFLAWTSHFYLWFNVNVLPFGNLFACFYLVILAYLLSRERLMDIRLILSKVYIYLVLIFFVYLFYTFFYYLDNGPTIHKDYITFFLRIIFALIFIVFFIPFLNLIQKTGDYIFFKGYNPATVIKDVLIKLTSVINLEELLDVLAQEFKMAIGSDRVGFLVFNLGANEEIEGFKFNPSINLSFIFHPSDAMMEKLQKEKSIIIRGELGAEAGAIAEEMDFHHVRNLAPLIYKDKVIGLMIIDDKESGESFTQEEIEFIEVMGRQASVAIINAMLHKQVEDLNEQLETKYKKKTSALKEQSEDLQEFFRISSLKIKDQLLSLKDIIKDQISRSSQAKKMLSEPYLKVLKTSDIINDIIKASEMDAGAFELSLEKVDLKKIMKKVYSERSTAAKLKNLKFTLDLPKEAIPPIEGNGEYLEQVVVSLVNNAIRYTESGIVAMSLERNDNDIIVRVKDSGIGIRKKDIPKLFQRFQRGTNAVATHPDGSGLGLFIAKKIIDSHKGASIYVEDSALNKGTVFALKFRYYD